jgi:hypothetical protein
VGTISDQVQKVTFAFRPWVRRAGLSIVIVASVAILLIVATLRANPQARYGWIGERFVWIYIGTLWLGGMKVWLGTMRPAAEAGDESLTVRPLHQVRERTIAWDSIRGTEQMIGGDRLIVFFETRRGQRFVALNLNLVKGRKDFMALIEQRLRDRGFAEKIVERSRYLARA